MAPPRLRRVNFFGCVTLLLVDAGIIACFLLIAKCPLYIRVPETDTGTWYTVGVRGKVGSGSRARQASPQGQANRRECSLRHDT